MSFWDSPAYWLQFKESKSSPKYCKTVNFTHTRVFKFGRFSNFARQILHTTARRAVRNEIKSACALIGALVAFYNNIFITFIVICIYTTITISIARNYKAKR